MLGSNSRTSPYKISREIPIISTSSIKVGFKTFLRGGGLLFNTFCEKKNRGCPYVLKICQIQSEQEATVFNVDVM